MARRRKGRAVSGWLVIDKPEGPTSTEVVNRVRRLFDARKAGHGGTLDPLATGILPIAFGEATKAVAFVMAGRKTYRFVVRWGEARSTDDKEGAITERSPVRPRVDEIERALPDFRGRILQRPPAFSALKVDGRRAYDLAREGAEIALAPRAVDVHALRLLETSATGGEATFELVCGKGTYVRALARDLALALGTVGHVAKIRRLSVGPFDEAQSISLDKIEELSHSPAASGALMPIETALDDIPALAVSGQDAWKLRHGQAVIIGPRDGEALARSAEAQLLRDLEGGTVRAMGEGGLVAIVRLEGRELKPIRVFNA